MESIDILILGGGPAGLSTALHLVKFAPHLAPRILVLEKAQYPRQKLCAGGLLGDAELLLDKLGLDVNEVPCVVTSSVQFHFRGKGLTINNPNKRLLRFIRRDEFDAWLAYKVREKGVDIREGIQVNKVYADADGLIVHTNEGDFRARIVIGADGSNSVTRRCIFPSGPLHVARVLEVFIPFKVSIREQSRDRIVPRGKKEINQNLTFLSDIPAVFDFFPIPQGIAGYTWHFPSQEEGIPMHCWGIYDANLFPYEKRPSLVEMLSSEMKRHGFDFGELDLKGHPIRWFDPFNDLSAPRVLLVGDAAGVDPLFGEGISIALGYGKVAATTIVDAFKHDKFDFKGYKRRVLTSPLGQVLIARWITANFIYSVQWPWFHILLWRFLKPINILIAWVFLLNWGRRM